MAVLWSRRRACLVARCCCGPLVEAQAVLAWAVWFLQGVVVGGIALVSVFVWFRLVDGQRVCYSCSRSGW